MSKRNEKNRDDRDSHNDDYDDRDYDDVIGGDESHVENKDDRLKLRRQRRKDKHHRWAA